MLSGGRIAAGSGAVASRLGDDRGRLGQGGKAPGGRQKPPRRIGVVPRGKRARLTRNGGLLRGFAQLRRRHEQPPQELAIIVFHGAFPITFHFTPKHASWLNQIEIWFSILARKLIRRGNFTSTEDLKTKIEAFIAYFNKTMAKPFKWPRQGKPLVAKNVSGLPLR